MDAFVMLQELLEQDQFELIFSEQPDSHQKKERAEEKNRQDIRLVYLMNDAVESFLEIGRASCRERVSSPV